MDKLADTAANSGEAGADREVASHISGPLSLLSMRPSLKSTSLHLLLLKLAASPVSSAP